MPYWDGQNVGSGTPVPTGKSGYPFSSPAVDEKELEALLAALLQGEQKKQAQPKQKSSGNVWENIMGGIGQFAQNTVNRVGPKTTSPEVDELEALFQQLMGAVQGQGGAQIDYESALQDSERAIRDAYANDISAIRQGNKIARRQTAQGRQELEAMYDALQKTYERTGRRTERQAGRMGDRMQQNANQSAKMLRGGAKDILGEQAALAQDLGIEAAVAPAAEDLQTEAMRQQQRIQREGSRGANRQIAMGANAQRAFEGKAANTQLASANRQGDLIADLQDYLQGNRAEINALKGDRGREIAANRSETMGNVAELNAASEKEMWDRLMGLAGLKLEIEQAQHSKGVDLAKLQQQVAEGTSGGPQLPGNFGESQQLLQSLQAPRRGNAIFEEVLSSPEVRYGQVQHPETNQMYKLTPYEAMEQIEALAQENNLSPQDVELLKLAIFAQMGG